MTAAGGGGGAGLPDFVVIGAQKAGTTSLWTYLRTHPDVFTPDVKELNFFAAEGNWGKGLDWYRSLFAGRRPGQVAGEASPGYTMFPIFAGAPARMASVIPDARLVYVIREPVARMVSNWRQSRADGLETRGLRESLLMDVRYVSLSQYATQIERYLEHYDRAALLVVRAEDLATQAEQTLAEICRFIGVGPGRLEADLATRHNVGEEKRIPRRRTLLAAGALRRLRQGDLAHRLITEPRRWTHRLPAPSETVVDDDLRQRLQAYLHADMVRLRAIVGPDMDLWGHA